MDLERLWLIGRYRPTPLAAPPRRDEQVEHDEARCGRGHRRRVRRRLLGLPPQPGQALSRCLIKFSPPMLLLMLLLQPAVPAEPPACSSYTQVHTGCAPTGGPPTFCGTAVQLYDGATALPNGTVVNGKRFNWEISMIAKLTIAAGDPVVSCARACEQEPACVGFALEPSSATTACFTVNSTRYTLTRLAHCPSYGYTRDPACQPTCGGPSDALRLPQMPAPSLYRPRPAVSAASGGARECAALCDRLPGCVGFSISNTTEALCCPTNTTGRAVTTSTPVLSYARASQHFATTYARSSCLTIMQALCPVSLSPTSCRVCTGRSQRPEHTAGCTADDVARYCATELDWWVASATDHVFEDDVSTMSQYCGVAEQTRKSIQWSAVAGGTVASQLAVRWPSTQAGASASLMFDIGDLTSKGGTAVADVSAASMSVRQLGSVFAQTAEYPNEKGAAFYPDILAPIYQGSINASVFEFLCFGKQNGSNGRRLSWESGGRQISNQRVAGGGGPAGAQQCQQICETEPSCNGFFLGATGDCHTVNATNVMVATSLEGASYRRKRTGLALVPNTTRSIWLDITVPTTAAPGVYTGTMVIKELAEQAALFSVPISLRVWQINPECLSRQLGSYGKAYGFDPTIVGQLYPSAPAPSGDTPTSIVAFTEFMCQRHVPAEALANAWATQRPLSDIKTLLSTGQNQCQQPLYNAAFLGIANPPRQPSPENITAAYLLRGRCICII